MSEKLTLDILDEAVKKAAAFRCVTEYQPAGGPGDKIFPPTYLGGVYATENRLISGRRVPCVLLDSVQSQANRMELALLQAWREGQISIPVITVDFSGHDLREVGRNFRITSLDAPHRIADAILRDSVLEVNGQPVRFKDSEYARRWGAARLHDATELFRLCPTALIFGTWGSPEKPGGLGAKFARAIVSEIEEQCRIHQVPIHAIDTMQELGRLCGIEVSAACAALVSDREAYNSGQGGRTGANH